jgi:hypothetical protein
MRNFIEKLKTLLGIRAAREGYHRRGWRVSTPGGKGSPIRLFSGQKKTIWVMKTPFPGILNYE